MRIDDAAPDFRLPDLTGGLHGPGDWRGRIVILNFWSCQCPHVDRTDALIQEWLTEDAWREVQVFRIASNAVETDAMLAGAAARKRFPLVLRDRGHVVADLYAAQTTPHVFVIEGGRIRYMGAVDDASLARRVPTRFHLQEAVAALLEGKAPPETSTPPYGCAIIREALE
jgi:peroxiredoxin